MSMILGLLTGYAAIRTFNNHKKGNEALTFGGNIEVTHAIKGRIRFRSNLLKDEKLVEGLIAQLTKIAGIQLVKPSLVAGSLLVEYDELSIDQDLLIGAIFKLIGFENKIEQMSKSKVLKEIEFINESLNYAVLDKTKGYLDLRTLLPISFIGLAGYKIVTSGVMTSPSSITLLWWAYNSMNLNGGKSC